jgi:hypothetical protein
MCIQDIHSSGVRAVFISHPDCCILLSSTVFMIYFKRNPLWAAIISFQILTYSVIILPNHSTTCWLTGCQSSINATLTAVLTDTQHPRFLAVNILVILNTPSTLHMVPVLIFYTLSACHILHAYLQGFDGSRHQRAKQFHVSWSVVLWFSSRRSGWTNKNVRTFHALLWSF